ncbi:MAG: hypothetical protein GXN95_01150 [Methanococci archaeon]|nr:hypothetical protein [Methanococci archaeon]
MESSKLFEYKTRKAVGLIIAILTFLYGFFIILYIKAVFNLNEEYFLVIIFCYFIVATIFSYHILKPKNLEVYNDGLKIGEDFYKWNEVVEFFPTLNSIQIVVKNKKEETFNWETPGLFKYRPQVEYLIKKDHKLLEFLREKIGDKERKK